MGNHENIFKNGQKRLVPVISSEMQMKSNLPHNPVFGKKVGDYTGNFLLGGGK